MLARSLGVGSRGIKTDRRDAQVLSEVSSRIDLPSVHIPSLQARELKSMLGMRSQLIRCRTKLINNLRGWARSRMLKINSGATNSFPERFQKINDFPSYIKSQLTVLYRLNEEITSANSALAEQAKNHAICQKLTTVPGIGPITALQFLATVDCIERFPNARKLQSYLGLTPGERSSSSKQQRTGITRAGCKALRWLLIEAAWNLQRLQPNHPLVVWALAIAQRRGKKIATVALARKLSGTLFAIWRDNSHFHA
jgi:transposase